MSAQVPVTCTSSSRIGRQSAGYHPNLWGNEFLTCPPDFKENDEDNKKLLELKQEIERMLLIDLKKSSQKLNLIDVLQRLGIAYHFDSEIDEILEKIHEGKYEPDHKNDYDDLNSTSLRFRLLRQQGYKISSDVFNKFKGIDGNFKESLATDVKGLLSLYEASYLRVHGEDILDETLDFSTKHLQSMATHIDTGKSLAKQINHALERPLRKGVSRIEARFYIQVYEEDPLDNEAILTFAKMDFNKLQKLHQKELSEILRWWKSLDFSRKLPFARDRAVECYFWIVGIYFEPKYFLARRTLTKWLAMTSVIDDIYDVYGTIEELELFTKAIERWDISATELMPEYMKYFYQAFLDMYKEIEKDIAYEENAYILHYAKKVMTHAVKNFFVEAIWCDQQYIPTVEEYMPVTLATGGSLWLVTGSFLGMGEIVTKEVFEWLLSNPKIVEASSIIGRFMGDVVSFKFEQKRKHVASTVECYMKQYGISEEHTIKLFHKKVEDAWKDINEECLKPTAVPMPLLDRILNFAKTVDFLYKYADCYTNPYHVKDHIASVLKNPTSV